MGVAASRKAAEVVGEEVRGDVLDGPAGADGGGGPGGVIERPEEFEECGALGGKRWRVRTGVGWSSMVVNG